MFFVMKRRHPRPTLTYPRFPYPTLFRSQEVVATADQVALEHFVGVADARFEFYEFGPLVVREGHFGEYGHRVGELGEIDVGFIAADVTGGLQARSEEHTSELQSLMRISYAVL